MGYEAFAAIDDRRSGGRRVAVEVPHATGRPVVAIHGEPFGDPSREDAVGARR